MAFCISSTRGTFCSLVPWSQRAAWSSFKPTISLHHTYICKKNRRLKAPNDLVSIQTTSGPAQLTMALDETRNEILPRLLTGAPERSLERFTISCSPRRSIYKVTFFSNDKRNLLANSDRFIAVWSPNLADFIFLDWLSCLFNFTSVCVLKKTLHYQTLLAAESPSKREKNI